jgi:ubiquinol-cytochrome c reductase cytochrome c1 subunit
MAGDLTPFVPEGTPVPPGGFIAMPPPLTADDEVTFDDGTKATVDQMAQDVAAFIAWASEPKQTERKQTGVAVMIYLLLFAGLTFLSYKRIWKDAH